MRLFLIIISTVIFLFVTINMFVTLVMFIAEDYHVIDHVTIYEVFESKRYHHITEKLMKNNYTLLFGDDETGVKNFIEHQANIHTVEGHPVVIKQYHSTNKDKQKLLKTIKETRFYMEMAFGIDRQERTQVFFVKTLQELPLEEIEFIKQKYPNDNIIIVSEKHFSVKIKGFTKIDFPPITIKQLKKAIHQYYGLKPKEIDTIVNNCYGSIEKIFKYFKKRSTLEGETIEEIVEVEDIEDLNEISHELAVKQRQKMKRKIKTQQNKAK